MNQAAIRNQNIKNNKVQPTPSANQLTKIISDSLSYSHFSMAYQPLFSIQKSRVVGFESLVRLNHPQYGVISPGVFIPHAENTGQILLLGGWILNQVFIDISRLVEQGMKNFYISLNISPVQLLKSTIFEDIVKLLKKYDIPPEYIKVELTETALITQPSVIKKVLDNLNKSGIQVWVDDFGTGYASLSLLRQFRVQGLKIDRMFINGIVDNNDDFTLCSAVIAMAQRLGLHIVAEGIEDEMQLQVLGQLGCDLLQGFFLGRPESLDKTIELWVP